MANSRCGARKAQVRLRPFVALGNKNAERQKYSKGHRSTLKGTLHLKSGITETFKKKKRLIDYHTLNEKGPCIHNDTQKSKRGKRN